MSARFRLHRWGPSILLLGLAGCSGNGQGLDQNGNPLGSSSSSSSSSSGGGGSSAEFQAIQDKVFTPICAQCHAGGGAPEGMQLTQGVSYGMIVKVQSQEVPSLDRVKPGDPDNSYLVQKIEGVAAVGAQMPYGCPSTQPCLDQATIDMIRKWVSDGAQPPSQASDAN